MVADQQSAVPNVKGTILGYTPGYNHDDTVTTNPFYVSDKNYKWREVGGGGSNPCSKVNMDLSRSSNVYKNGITEVRPSNIAVRYIIKY